MKRVFFIIIGIMFLALALLLTQKGNDAPAASPQPVPVWSVRSIDTMKYSRDVAREKLKDASFDMTIDQQVKAIAETGATHVAIATPYDEEFVPFLARWVAAARRYNLHVWFRGNLSGWEKWFDYPSLSREAHTTAIATFIKTNPTLFENGDLFTSCPECENGGPGDPRMNGDVAGHRAFLISESQAAAAAFRAIGKNVSVSYQSMNYDVAKLVMDRETTRALGGVVGIDHYVQSPDQLARDIAALHDSSGGYIFLSEFGAPIPDIHGAMTPDQQADWIRTTLERVSQLPEVIGVNYWVNVGGSTALWNQAGVARPGVAILKDYYSRLVVKIK